MRKLLSSAVIVTVALAFSGTAMAARVRAEPSGARRATSTNFTVSDAFGFIEVECDLILDGNFSRDSEGNLGVLGSIVLGSFTRASVANCVGGTMRVELLTAAQISIKEVTNRGRIEIWILNARVLIEDEMREYRCLYDALLRATTRENPVRTFEAILERVLEVRTLMGSRVCPGNGFVVATGTFTLDQAVTFTLTT